MNRAAVAAAVTVAFLLLAVGAFGAPAPQGAISGAVQNLTGGKAKAVGGQTVTLTIYVNNAEVDKKTATTDARGAFTFAVPADPARTYLVNVKYKGGDYDSPQVTFKVGEIAKQVTMRVYEPTTDASVLRVNIQHMIVEPGEGLVQITELLVFANPTDRTYVGAKVREDGKRETLQFRLPDGAANVSYLEGLMECCVFAAPGGFLDTMDVKPGTREIGFNYTIPYARGQATVLRTLDYPTDAVEVFGGPAAQLTVAPLVGQAPVATEQGTYSRFSGQSLARGTQITLGLSGLPVPKSSSRRLLIAAFAGVIAAALVYPLLRRRTRPAGQTPATREDLIKAIAALDDLHEAGGIVDADYRRQRARYKHRLLELTTAARPTEEPRPDRAGQSP